MQSDLTLVKDNAALKAARKYYELCDEIEELEAKKKKLRNIILGACPTKVNVVGSLKVSLCPGKWVLDQKLAERAGIDLEPYKVQGDEFWKIEQMA